jgi:hypothetical protein
MNMSDPFHVDLSEQIAFMVETDGYALEAAAPQPELDPPVGGHSYTVGFPDHTGFADVAAFGG